jgi:hypothetical protein
MICSSRSGGAGHRPNPARRVTRCSSRSLIAAKLVVHPPAPPAPGEQERRIQTRRCPSGLDRLWNVLFGSPDRHAVRARTAEKSWPAREASDPRMPHQKPRPPTSGPQSKASSAKLYRSNPLVSGKSLSKRPKSRLLARLVRHALNRGNVLEGPLTDRIADAGNPAGCQGQIATRLRRSGCCRSMAVVGHEDQFPPPGLNASCRFS